MFLIPDEKCNAFCRHIDGGCDRFLASDRAGIDGGIVAMVLKWGGMARTDVPFLSDEGHAECQTFLTQVWDAERKRDEPMIEAFFEEMWDSGKRLLGRR